MSRLLDSSPVTNQESEIEVSFMFWYDERVLDLTYPVFHGHVDFSMFSRWSCLARYT